MVSPATDETNVAGAWAQHLASDAVRPPTLLGEAINGIVGGAAVAAMGAMTVSPALMIGLRMGAVSVVSRSAASTDVRAVVAVPLFALSMARAGAAFGGVTQTVAYCLGERDGEASSALVGGALGCCWPLLPSMSDKELRIPSRLGRAVRLPAAGALGATLGLLAWRLCRSAPVVELEPCAQPGRRVAGEQLADPWDGPARRSSRGAE